MKKIISVLLCVLLLASLLPVSAFADTTASGTCGENVSWTLYDNGLLKISGNGEMELKSAMDFILDYNKASEERLQFSKYDKIIVIPFDSNNRTVLTGNGSYTGNLITKINQSRPGGGTNIYGCTVEALKQLEKTGKDYMKSVILMSDGYSNIGRIEDVASYYSRMTEKIPVYSIMFGQSSEDELENLANLTNAKVFDGRTSLIRAFKEVRSYN